jgi:hypothetical protein
MKSLVLFLACALVVRSAFASLGDNGMVTYSGRGRQPNTLVFGNQLLIDNVVQATLDTAGQMLLGTWRPTPNEPATDPAEVSCLARCFRLTFMCSSLGATGSSLTPRVDMLGAKCVMRLHYCLRSSACH